MALTNAQYDRIMRVYDDKRTLRSREADERLEEVCAAIPGYRDLIKNISACYAAIARDNLKHPDSPDPELRSSLEAYLETRSALLRENGFPPDYTDVRPDCPKCGDTGYINGVKCDCFDRIALSLFYRDHFLDRIPREHDFKHFKTDLYSDTINNESGGPSPRAMAEEALRAAQRCVSELTAAGEKTSSETEGDREETAGTPWSLLIYGQAGVGKTFLSEAILNEAASLGRPGLYFSSQEFFDLLADAAFGRSEEAASYASLILGGDLLVIDDLGTELTNTYVESELFRVLNERCRGGLTTVISTNLTPGELASRYSERIFSRMMSGFRLVKLTGEDIRLKRAVKQPV